MLAEVLAKIWREFWQYSLKSIGESIGNTFFNEILVSV